MKRILYIPMLLVCLQAAAQQQCPPRGDAKTVLEQRYNMIKNKSIQPAPSDIDTTVTLAAILNAKDKPDGINENKAATITGYVVKVVDNGPQSCNCHSYDAATHDFHLFIAPERNEKNPAQCMIVEITPYTRQLHPELTLKYLNSIAGHKVTITGWLFWDWGRRGESAASNAAPKNVKRATVWELHPVTGFQDLTILAVSAK